MKEGSELWSLEGAASAYDEPNVEHENCSTESRRNDDKDVISTKLRSFIKELAANKLSATVKEVLDYILRNVLHGAQNCIGLVVHNIVDHVILDLLRVYVNEKTFAVHIAKTFHTDASDVDRLSKMLLSLNTLIASICNFC